MKKTSFLPAIILASLAINGCDWPWFSPSESSSESENISETQSEREYEVYADEIQPRVTFDKLVRLNPTNMNIDGINNFIIDPFTSGMFGQEATIRYPDADQLAGKNIIYTSAWYSRYTFDRGNCIEYALENFDGEWFVSEVKNNGHTFIPFNGAVISVTSSLGYEVGDYVEIENDSIKTNYALGIYNQDGYRISVSSIDDGTWESGAINLYTQNNLSTVTSSSYQKFVTMNFDYDEKSNAYRYGKTHTRSQQGRTSLNLLDGGFVLVSTLTDGTLASQLLNGVRFHENDLINIEANGKYTDLVKNVNLGDNTYYLNDGTVISYTITKSTSTSSNKWLMEVSVDKNGTIVDFATHVNIPNGGYKLVFGTRNNTPGEYLQKLIKPLFQKGNTIKINKNNVSIYESNITKTETMWEMAALKVEQDLEKLEYNAIDYDLDTLTDIQDKLSKIKNKIDTLADSENPTDYFYIYTLYGASYKYYYQLLGLDTRNEAVSVRTTWYIVDFSGRDKDLPSIQEELDNIKKGGINEIIVSPLSSGKAYYTDSKILPVSNQLNGKKYGEYGNDYTKAIIAEAHKRGMMVLANYTPFTMGLEKGITDLANHKALSINGETSVTSSQGKVEMLDPASDLVQQKIMEVARDFMTCNDFDGICLDYIRYGADNNDIHTVMGVTDEARVKFNAYCKSKGLTYSYSTLEAFRNGLKNGTVFSYFNQFEQKLIHDTVANCKAVVKEFKKPLCAAIADNYSAVKAWKCQDWASWAKDGIIDGLYLMDYYFDAYYVDYYVKDMLTSTTNPDTTLCVGAVDPSYAQLNDESYALVIKGALENNSSMGYGIFGTHTQRAKGDGWTLTSVANYREALSPYDTLYNTMHASFDLLIDRCDRIYHKYELQDDSQYNLLKEDIEDLYLLIDGENVSSCNKVLEQIDAMMKKSYAYNDANTKIKNQLTYIRKIVTVKINIIG